LFLGWVEVLESRDGFLLVSENVKNACQVLTIGPLNCSFCQWKLSMRLPHHDQGSHQNAWIIGPIGAFFVSKVNS